MFLRENTSLLVKSLTLYLGSHTINSYKSRDVHPVRVDVLENTWLNGNPSRQNHWGFSSIKSPSSFAGYCDTERGYQLSRLLA